MADNLSSFTPRRDRWHRFSYIVMAVGVATLIAAGLLFALSLGRDDGNSDAGTATAFGEFNDLLRPQPTPAAPLPTPSEAPIARIAIPRFEINAPVVVRGVDASNTMETPDGPTDVAWYDFSGKPGFGSNAVFSGHVDYINYGPAVFYHLKDMSGGDIVEVRLDDGTVYTYSVSNVQNVTADVSEDVLLGIIGPTTSDVVTLITCGGAWDGQQYSHRVIVRAERVLDAASPGQAAGVPSS